MVDSQGLPRNSGLQDEVMQYDTSADRHHEMVALNFTLGPDCFAPTAFAQPVHWDNYSIAETGISVDISTSIFSEWAPRRVWSR